MDLVPISVDYINHIGKQHGVLMEKIVVTIPETVMFWLLDSLTL